MCSAASRAICEVLLSVVNISALSADAPVEVTLRWRKPSRSGEAGAVGSEGDASLYGVGAC
eukprot:309694-Rhodomonas_salina.1